MHSFPHGRSLTHFYSPKIHVIFITAWCGMLCEHAEHANCIVFRQPFINIMASRTDANEYYKQFVRPETTVTRYGQVIHIIPFKQPLL
jgi:phenolic acid decarboxylase